jgi:hypothetical protein
VRHLAGHELRRIRHPDIALTFAIDHPRNPRRLLGRNELRRKRCAQYLLDGETFRKADARHKE